MSKQSATAIAHANLALVKYWGKAPGQGKMPAVGSLSLGLEALQATTTVSLASGADRVLWGGKPAEAGKASRILAYLDLWRRQFGLDQPLAVETCNNFPTGAGLASSAAGFAALALALDALLDARLDPGALSRLARQGSGSAARSLFGGYVELPAATGEGEGPAARQLLPAEDWPLHVLVAITDAREKPIGSTEAMQACAATSPFYPAWVASHPDDMAEARQAILARDFPRLAAVAEQSCLKMHAAILASKPPILYWTPATLAVVHLVREARDQGLAAFFSIDAGPQVKAVCQAEAVQPLRERLAALSGVKQVIHSPVGGAPSVSVQAA